MAEHMSVYGYDSRMLSRDEDVELQMQATESRLPLSPVLKNPNSVFPLLALPHELRQEILKHVLPKTTKNAQKGTVWSRGHTAIMRANRLLYNESIRLLYGSNTFVLDVAYHGTSFAYQWFLPSGLIPNRTLRFPEDLADRNIQQMQYLVVRVKLSDPYTGSINYGYGGPGLKEGVRQNVARLCDTLKNMDRIRDMWIFFQHQNSYPGADEIVLPPFLKLRNTEAVHVIGNQDVPFAKILGPRLNGAFERNSFFRLPIELRERVYDILLPSTETMIRTHPTQHKYIRWRYGHLAILRTCSAVYKEASRYWYGTRNFQLLCGGETFQFTPFFLPKGRLLPGIPFVEKIGADNVPLIKRFTIYMPVWWGRPDKDEKCKRRRMLERLGRLLQTVPKIASLTMACFCWNLDTVWYEDAMHEFLRIRGVGNVEIFGLDRDITQRFKSAMESPAETSSRAVTSTSEERC